MRGVFSRLLLPLAFLLVFALNLRRMAPTITTGDSAELACAQSTLGIAHSPGYPLFVLAGKLFSEVVPAGHAAYRTNLFSALLSALSLVLCFLLLKGWSDSRLLALSGALALLFAPVVRAQFLATEVFALNFLWTLLLLWVVVPFILSLPAGGTPAEGKRFLLAFFLLGLGFGNQQTIILFLPSLALIALRHYYKEGSARVALFLCAFFFLLGLSVYLFLPVRSCREPLLDWEDPQTWERFKNVFSRARYGTFQLAQGGAAGFSLERVAARTLFFLREARLEFGTIPFSLLTAGILISFFRKRLRPAAIVLSVFFFLAGPFFLSLSNVTTARGGYEILIRFLPLSFIGFFLLGTMGISHSRFNTLLALLFFSSLFLPGRIAQAREEWQLYDYGRSVLKTLPPGSLILCDRADETEFSLAYLLYAGGLRPDVRFVDCNAGVTRSIYGEDYYAVWGRPRLERREIVERDLIARHNGPVFYATVEPDMIAIPRLPFGLLHRAKPASTEDFAWNEIYSFRGDVEDIPLRVSALEQSESLLLGRYFLAAGEPARAERFFRRLVLLDETGRWPQTVALWYYEKGREDMAERYFIMATRRGPEPEKAWCNLGLIYEKRGKPASAEECYRTAVNVNPRSFQAHYNLGAFYWKEGRWRDVVKEFESALAIEPGNEETARFLAAARRKVQPL